MKKEISQISVVLSWLKENRSITSMQAFNFSITRLADIIYKLRKQGYDIETRMCNGKNMYGVYTYAEYRLVGEPNGK